MPDPNMVGPRHDDIFGELPPSLPKEMYLPGALTFRCAICPEDGWIYVTLSEHVGAKALEYHHRHAHTAEELRRIAAGVGR